MRTRLVCLAACLCFPLAAFAQFDYDRHVVFDNSLADGSWYLQPRPSRSSQRIGPRWTARFLWMEIIA
jgi:hypothetical protein